jgi:hypothetical protein
MTDFTRLTYLINGNPKQQQVYHLLKQYKVLEKLMEFNPVLTGTIPIDIDTDKSDLDIICQVKDFDAFSKTVQKHFGNFPNYHTTQKTINGKQSIIIRFQLEKFQLEIFGQNTPVTQQNAYQHMLIEHRILLEKGNDFRQKIIQLKRQGIKTEPAFAQLLGLKGNPYQSLLQYKSQPEK